MKKLSRDEFDKLTGAERYEAYCLLFNDNVDLRYKVSNYEECKKLANHKKYVSCSEQMELVFDEAEVEHELQEPKEEEEEKAITIKEHKRKIRKRTCSVSKETPIYDVDHTKDAPEEKIVNGVLMVADGTTEIYKIAYVPAQRVVERHIYVKYRAVEAAGDKRSDNVRVLFENPVVDGIACSPSFIAWAAVSKYDDHIPLYRIEEMLARENLMIPRQKLAQWIIKYYTALIPLFNLIKKKVFASKLINLDETGVMVLDVTNDKGRPSNNNFVYITVGSEYDDVRRIRHALMLCEYHEGRTTDDILHNLKEYNYDGYILTDGLKQYYKYWEPEKHASCWVHAVRDFKDALKINEKDEVAKKICLAAAKLYKIDDKYRAKYEAGEIDKAEFLSLRKSESLEKINEIFALCKKHMAEYPSGGTMGKGFAYIQEYKDYLTVYLDCAEATPSNNICERTAKAFATGRKNWLFSQTVDGVEASCFFYTLVENAKLQGLNPMDYIEYVCTFGPYCKSSSDWESMLPWNADISRLAEIRQRRINAKPDPDRAEPYIFAGNVTSHF